MPVIDWTLNVGTLIQVIVLCGGGLLLFANLQNKVSNLAINIALMKDDLKALNQVITSMAVYDIRIQNIEQDIRELRHGDGFVMNRIDER